MRIRADLEFSAIQVLVNELPTRPVMSDDTSSSRRARWAYRTKHSVRQGENQVVAVYATIQTSSEEHYRPHGLQRNNSNEHVSKKRW